MRRPLFCNTCCPVGVIDRISIVEVRLHVVDNSYLSILLVYSRTAVCPTNTKVVLEMGCCVWYDLTVIL